MTFQSNTALLKKELEEFIKDEARNICEIYIEKENENEVIMGIFGSSITLVIEEGFWQDITLTCKTSDEICKPVVEKTNEECKGSTKLSPILESIDKWYSKFHLENEDDDSEEEEGEEEDKEVDEDEMFDSISSDLVKDHEDDPFLTPTTLGKMDDHFKEVDMLQQWQLSETVRSDDMSKTIRKMTMNADSDWKTVEAEMIMYLEFYSDGFIINQDGNLRDLEDPEQKKLLEELEQGDVPEEFNPEGYEAIDCHVLRYNCKFEDRKNKNKVRIDF